MQTSPGMPTRTLTRGVREAGGWHQGWPEGLEEGGHVPMEEGLEGVVVHQRIPASLLRNGGSTS